MGIFDRFKKKSIENNQLIGKWCLIDAEGDFDIGEGVTMHFKPNGNLEYCIDAGDKLQIMNLIYRIEGDVIVTDQHSQPAEERTPYEIDSEGRLVLHYDDGTKWLERMKNS